MEVLLDCSICRNSFDYEQRQPHILACGHTFCRTCLTHMRSSLQSIRCPIDRRIEIREMHKLPVNYALLQVIDHYKTGISTKEKCHIHKFPISMICRTCYMNCCPKCIRRHSNHDVFDIENPVILKDIENRLTKYEAKLRVQYERCNICNNRISFEIDKLKYQQEGIRKDINLYYDRIIQNLEAKRQQSFDTLDYYYKDKVNTLNQQARETNEQFRYYEQHLNDLLNCKKELYDQLYVDRAVTCMHVLRELDLVHFSEVPDINNQKLRLSTNCTKMLPKTYGSISILEQSPLELLEREINETLEVFHSNLSKYAKSNIEEKLCLEILSTSIFLMLTSDNIMIAKIHIIENVCKEVLGQNFFQLKTKTQMRIASKSGIEQAAKQDYSLYAEGMKNRVVYTTGLIFGLEYIKKNEWKEALQILHYLMVKHSNNTIAKQTMSVLFLIMCSEGYKMLKIQKLSNAYAIFETLLYYMKFHIFPENIVYQQILRTLVYIKTSLHTSVAGRSYREIQSRLTEMVSLLSKPCDYIIITDLPHPVQNSVETIMKGDYTFSKNEELSREFMMVFQKFKDRVSSWWLALQLIVDKNEVLSDQEQEKLEMGTIKH